MYKCKTHYPHPLLLEYNQSFSPGFAFVQFWFFPLSPFLVYSIDEESHNVEQHCDYCVCGGRCVNKADDCIILQPFLGLVHICGYGTVVLLQVFIFKKQEMSLHNTCSKISTSV